MLADQLVLKEVRYLRWYTVYSVLCGDDDDFLNGGGEAQQERQVGDKPSTLDSMCVPRSYQH